MKPIPGFTRKHRSCWVLPFPPDHLQAKSSLKIFNVHQCLLIWKKINCRSLPLHTTNAYSWGDRVYGVFLYLQSVQLCCEPKTGLQKQNQTTKHLFPTPKQKQSLPFIAHNPANAPLPHTPQVTSQNTRLSFYLHLHLHLQGRSANFVPIADGPWAIPLVFPSWLWKPCPSIQNLDEMISLPGRASQRPGTDVVSPSVHGIPCSGVTLFVLTRERSRTVWWLS